MTRGNSKLLNGANEVRWHPPATGIADGGFSMLTPVNIRFRGKRWTIAWSHVQHILWVLADSDQQVKNPENAADLADLARAFRQHKTHELRDYETNLPPVDTSVEGVSKRGREVSAGGAKRLELRAVTESVKVALAAGCTLAEVRVAVYAAMGLDDEAAA